MSAIRNNKVFIMLSHKQWMLASLLSSFLIFSAFADSSLQYTVTHVADNDSLNIRVAAGVGNDVVATIPFNGTGIKIAGAEQVVGKTVWVKINWQDKQGWVSRHYLQQISHKESKPKLVAKTVKIMQEAPQPTKWVTEVEDRPVAVVEKEEVSVEAKIEAKTVVATESDIENIKEAPELQTPVMDVDVDDIHTSNRDTIAFEKKSIAKDKDEKLAGNWILQCGAKKPYWKVELRRKSLELYRDKYIKSLPITLKKQHKNKWNTALKTIVKGKKGNNNLEMTIKYAYTKRCYDTLSGLVVPYKVTTIFNGETLTGCCHAVELKKEGQERQISKAP